jgi:hypothetical protein
MSQGEYVELLNHIRTCKYRRNLPICVYKQVSMTLKNLSIVACIQQEGMSLFACPLQLAEQMEIIIDEMTHRRENMPSMIDKE